ncbi:Demethylrebeccamycin-D-glucose O-methyltransferase [Halomicronema hongdechloris C2206]|uniref:Demethylrebeccamycin-D-glucose O-methyltransferase n=1 Tax=Halomicronema hongdechloris C2206 TaxID=1641165 RepID=A0A1Z3HJL7_9CYAN|nr:class I SAM-dependent methyltransferase [Halomicronema hongdechloris]ASC70483.1 Demethylrebeccamycin-D-glucose O-methyltransferase [Halomicronema hongdechloris C2206]
MTVTPLNLKTAPGHQVLAAAGKQTLRPGGRAATEQLFAWANFQPGDTVLELAASFGYSAIALAQRYGVTVVGVEKNPDSVARARANVTAAGVEDAVQILEGDIFHLEQISDSFDYVLAEAILTMQSAPGKAKILQGICDRIKPGGQFLSHELVVDGPDAVAIQRELAATIRVNAQPLCTDDWLTTCRQAGLAIEQYDTGPMALLNPRRIAQEEGLATLLRLGWNLLTRPILRRRILEMRRVFTRHRQELGYIVLGAKKAQAGE